MDSGRRQFLVLTTPEGVAFRLPLAGPFSRGLAVMVDWLVVNAVLSLVMTVVQLVGVLNVDIGGGVYFLLAFLLPVLYAMVLESVWRGQTLGKRLLKLRVIDQEGLRLQASQVVVRNLLRTVDSLPLFYLVGGVAALLSNKAQRLGDLAANTVVIRHGQAFSPDLSVLAGSKYNSLKAYPLIISRLRQKLGRADIALIIRALNRRAQLEPQARIALYAELAAYIRTKVDFPDESLVGLSDEQLLRNVAEVIFHAGPKSRRNMRLPAGKSPL